MNISLAGAILMFVLTLAAYLAIPYCIAENNLTSGLSPRAFPQLLSVLVMILHFSFCWCS